MAKADREADALEKAIDDAMKACTFLSIVAKQRGNDLLMYSANRAWREIDGAIRTQRPTRS